ncbi:pseudouridine synthase [Terriglobus aquaticus]|uniref:Pseudouridine synthase n=1 Tax=Terriglobus aquaticus TaxID=940139 RepID=A0ABW9KLW3_9BACT|nr:pseudouridine synthase [Terriglobus aquaticus]
MKKQAAAPEPREGVRLQKILAEAGIASRRKAEELIEEGRVQINGEIVTELGTRADVSKDHIRVDGKLIQGVQEHRYFMVNKPRGYVTTMSDPERRETVVDLLRETARKSGRKLDVRLYPVGRLDYNSEGLLLMTNDGNLANNLSKAANSVEKTYLVKVAGQPTEEALEQLRSGVMIDRGRLAEVRGTRRDRVMTAPARVELARRGDNPWYEVTLTEGRNRQLRKMFEEIGHHVEKIRRIGYGALTLDVPIGDFRELTPGEVQALSRAAAGKSVQRKQRLSEHAQLKKSGQKTGSRGARPRF